MIAAIIVAAGKGTRMGSAADKLFLEVAGRPVVAHTWQRFDEAKCIGEIILVVRDGMQNAFKELAAKFICKNRFALSSAGAERQDSVWNGLEALSPEAEIVAIQDAARPCTTRGIDRGHGQGGGRNRRGRGGAAGDGHHQGIRRRTLIQRTLDRSRFWAVQTPQTFRVEVIRRALAEARRRRLVFTDDTAACELIGQPVRLVSEYRAQSQGHGPRRPAVHRNAVADQDMIQRSTSLKPVQPRSAGRRPGVTMVFPNEPGRCPAFRKPGKRVLQRFPFVLISSCL